MDLDRSAASQEHGEQECDGTSVLPGEDEQGVAERDGPAASHGAQLSIAAPITPGTPPSVTQQSSSQGGSSLQTGESLSHSKTRGSSRLAAPSFPNTKGSSYPSV